MPRNTKKADFPFDDLGRLFFGLWVCMDCGVPLLPAMRLLGEDSFSVEFADSIRAMSDDIEKGAAFCESMSMYPQFFPKTSWNS